MSDIRVIRAKDGPPFDHIDLFSGIGGFALGLESTGYFRTVQFVECEPYCQKVLEKHWPGVPIHDDIKTFEWQGQRPFIITGGFPCQPFSSASRGRRRGSSDDRFLWPFMCDTVERFRPGYVIVENVDEIIGQALDGVLSDLADMYYTAGTYCVPACAVGAPHLRERAFIVAYADGQSEPRRAEYAEMGRPPQAPLDVWPHYPAALGMGDGLPDRLDRLRGLGNAIVPQIAAWLGEAIVEHWKSGIE